MANRFLERLERGEIVVADGGMGALVTSAVRRLRCPEEANLRAPETVVSLHVSFIRAGADLIETNTFGANRRKLAQHYLEDETAAINSAAVKLARDAREVSGRDVFIAGSIGPLGELGPVDEDERRSIFAEQATVLEGRGVDLFVVETFFDLEELVTAIEAVREVCALPIVAMLTFDEDAETLGGVSAGAAAERLAPLGLAAIGANHGAGIQAALAALAEMRAGGDSVALAAMPNIGLASLVGSRVVYPHATPDYFAEFAAHARELGARVIGGCCGTTPAEIAAIAAAVKEERAPTAPFVVAEQRLAAKPQGEVGETKLARDLREGNWVVSIQIDPPLGGDYSGLLEMTRTIKASGKAGFVDINDNATGRASMSGMVMAAAIERHVGVETIPHLTARDYSVLGLEALLLGGHAEGVRNVLAVTGDPAEVGDYPGARGIWEVDSIGLVKLMAALNRGENYVGKSIDAPTSFFIGVAVNPTADDLDVEVGRYRRKLEEGAHFAMTQILYDLRYYDEFLERFGGPSPIPVLIGLFPLSTYRLALRLHNEVPGIVVPEELQEAMRDAGPDAAAVGMEHASRLYRQARDRAAGVYVATPFRRPLAALDVLT